MMADRVDLHLHVGSESRLVYPQNVDVVRGEGGKSTQDPFGSEP
jgi:hypothetical protein